MVASNRESICMRMLRSKYKVRRDWLYKSPPKNSSPIRRAIEKGKNLIVKGACFMVGNGENISVWKDPWVPYLEDFKPIPRDASSQVRPLMVSNLIDPQTRVWKQDVLGQLFTLSSIEAINKIVFPWIPRPDKLVWVKEPIGDFSIKSAYKLSQEPPTTSNEDVEWDKIWKLKVHERTKMFIWRIGANLLLTKDRIAQRLGGLDSSCSLCGEKVETSTHLFFKCTIARAIWFGCNWGLCVDSLNLTSKRTLPSSS